MEKRAMGAGRGKKPYGKRQPHPGTMRDWRGGYVGAKERQEMKSAGQSEVRARRCCCRPSLTFILGMLITDRGERESGPPGTGEGPLAVVRAKLGGSGNGSRDPGETSAQVQAKPDRSKDRKKRYSGEKSKRRRGSMSRER